MSGSHVIIPKLDDRDLYIGLCARCCRSSLCEEGYGHSGVDEGGMF